MLRTIMRRREAGWSWVVKETSADATAFVSIRKLLRDAIRPTKGYVNGMIRLLRGPWQSSHYRHGIERAKRILIPENKGQPHKEED